MTPASLFDRHRYLGFLISLVVLLFTQPLAGETQDVVRGLTTREVFVGVVMTVILVWGMLASCTRKRHRVIGFSLAVLTMVAAWALPQFREAADHAWTYSTFGLLLRSAPALFYFYTAVLTLNFVLRNQRVTQERIAAALCVYLLVGFGFSLVYQFIYEIQHVQEATAFALPESLGGEDPQWGDFIFFSFVTMTTLGYGDMVPTNEWARSLAMLQTIFAVFYLAVLIARLVASYTGVEGSRSAES